MMADVINISAERDRRSLVQPDISFRDDKGTLWYQYVCDYYDGDQTFTFEIWAESYEDAERRMNLIKKNGVLVGQLVDTIDA